MNIYIGQLPNNKILDDLKKDLFELNIDLELMISGIFINFEENRIKKNDLGMTPIKFFKLLNDIKDNKLIYKNNEYNLIKIKEEGENIFYLLDIEINLENKIHFFKNLLSNINKLNRNSFYYFINNTFLLNSKNEEINNIMEKLELENDNQEDNIIFDDKKNFEFRPFLKNNIKKIPEFNKEKNLFNYDDLYLNPNPNLNN